MSITGVDTQETGTTSQPTLFELLPEQVLNDYFVKPFLLSPVLGEKSGVSTKPYRWLNDTVESEDLKETLAALTPPTSIPLNKMIQLVCKHKPLADKIMDLLFDDATFEDRPGLKKEILILFGRYSLPIAERIIADDELRKKLTTFELSGLGCEHLSIALQILNDEGLASKLDAITLGVLGYSHLPVAQLILANMNLLSKLEDIFLTMLGEGHESIAQKLFNDNSLRNKLTIDNLVTLGSQHSSIAERIMNDDKLLDSLPSLSLLRLGIKQLFVAQKIFNTERFRERMDLDSLAELAANHFSIAQQIMNDDVLRYKFRKKLAYIGCKHPVIREQIMQNSYLPSQLSEEDYFFLNAGNLDIAKEVMSNESLRNRLSAGILRNLACNHLSVAQQIITDEALCKKLNGLQLYDIALKYSSIAKIIMRDQTMIGKLVSASTFTSLISRHPDLALENTDLIMKQMPLLEEHEKNSILKELKCATLIRKATSKVKDEVGEDLTLERKKMGAI